MGRLSTVTTLLILGAWGAATDGAPPDNAAPTTTATARPPSPVPPVEYLKAGARLFNDGLYPKAAQYLQAAQMYRDQLTGAERTVLDAYLKEMTDNADAAPPGASAAPAPAPAAPAVTAAAPVEAAPELTVL